jgi:hypothetical protein
MRVMARANGSLAPWSIASLEGHGAGIARLQDRKDIGVQGLHTRQACMFSQVVRINEERFLI